MLHNESDSVYYFFSLSFFYIVLYFSADGKYLIITREGRNMGLFVTDEVMIVIVELI